MSESGVQAEYLTEVEATEVPPALEASSIGRRPVAPFIALGLAVLIAGFVFVLAQAPKGDGPESAATPLLGKAAPDLKGETLDGSTFDLASRRGSWVVLNFFSSTCVPCQEEHAALVEFNDAQAAKPVETRAELVSSVFNEDVGPVRKFFQTRGGGNWPVVLDKGNEGAYAYSVAKVPETWIIDPNGVIRKHLIETVTAERLELLLTQLRTGAGS